VRPARGRARRDRRLPGHAEAILRRFGAFAERMGAHRIEPIERLG